MNFRHFRIFRIFLAVFVFGIGLQGCSKGGEQTETPVADVPQQSSGTSINIDAVALENPPNDQWYTHGRDYGEQRHSPLNKIDDKNVGDLGLAWFFDLNSERGIEATPLVIDGVMYTTGNWSVVHALDAKTGKHLWTYDPQVSKKKGAHACCDVVNRGVAAWGDKIYVGALDGRLIALDRATGEPQWSTATFDPEKTYTITGAPRVVKGRVIIGNGGAEYGVRGFVSAYDADTGELAWRFYTVPGNPADGFENKAMEMAARTWTGEWWKFGGGGTVWDSMAFDPELDQLYIGVGNGSPWNQSIRSPEGGDNLFLSSIVALNPDTGEYLWHYQTTPGETWDYTATQHMILADLEIGGTTRKTIVQAPKNGFFYVIDRTNGDLISAENYVPVNWASGIDPETGRPIEIEGARYRDGPHVQMPAPYGGHNWHPMSFSPATGLVYIPALDIPFVYNNAGEFEFRSGTWNTGLDLIIGSLPDDRAQREAAKAVAKGALIAWDPKTQKEVWRFQQKGAWNGGALSTAGNLVFQGAADGQFSAYDATIGTKLWSAAAQTGIVAAPVTYEIDGEQYVAVMAGWGGSFALVHGHFRQPESATKANRVLVYKLNADVQLPALDITEQVFHEPPALTATAEDIAEGKALFQSSCQFCHGDSAVGGGLIPDLRYSAMIQAADSWKLVVYDGALQTRGMAGFSSVFDEAEVELIRQYVINEAQTDWQLKNSE